MAIVVAITVIVYINLKLKLDELLQFSHLVHCFMTKTQNTTSIVLISVFKLFLKNIIVLGGRPLGAVGCYRCQRWSLTVNYFGFKFSVESIQEIVEDEPKEFKLYRRKKTNLKKFVVWYDVIVLCA